MAGKPLYDQMSALLSYANGITGASDSKLGDAVRTLANGYGQGGSGLTWADVLYDDENMSITYTGTTATAVKTISPISGIATYPFLIVIILNNDKTVGNSKFYGSVTGFANTKYATNQVALSSANGFGLYYNSSGSLAYMSAASYGLWAYSINASANSITIRGRCYSSLFSSLTGTYTIKILGIK